MTPFTTFADCVAYLSRCTNYERMTDFRYCRAVLNLDPVRQVLAGLGKPHTRYPIVHVAGTKGKGSVCAYVAGVLRQAGYHVGSFTKPHLLRLNERLCIDGRPVSDRRFVKLMNTVYPWMEDQRKQGTGLTFFDVIVVLALRLFAEEAVEVAVVEVGFGGRLDSTNVVTPAVAVITNIGLDHTALLGDTPARIAAEKAGIIKPGVPVVSGETAAEPAQVIAGVAAARDAQLRIRDRDFRLVIPPAGATFEVRTWRRAYTDLSVRMLGEHQRCNAAVAVAALEALAETTDLRPTLPHLRRGLATTTLPGRIQVLAENPPTILDVAHNPSSLRALRRVIQEKYAGRRVVLLVGMAADKELEKNLHEILPAAAAVVFTGTGHPRAALPRELRDLSRRVQHDLDAVAEPDIDTALRIARRKVDAGSLLCVTGSFYLAGEVARRWSSLFPPEERPAMKR